MLCPWGTEQCDYRTIGSPGAQPWVGRRHSDRMEEVPQASKKYLSVNKLILKVGLSGEPGFSYTLCPEVCYLELGLWLTAFIFRKLLEASMSASMPLLICAFLWPIWRNDTLNIKAISHDIWASATNCAHVRGPYPVLKPMKRREESLQCLNHAILPAAHWENYVMRCLQS